MKNLRGNCRKTRDDQLLQPRLGWEDTQGSLLKESNWSGQEAVYAACLLSCAACASITSTTYFICLVMPWRVWLQLWWEGIWQLQGFEGWGGGHPRPCQFRFLCLCLWMLQQEIRGSSLLNEACKTSLLCSQERQSKKLKLKIKLWGRLTTFVVFIFVPKYRTLECDDLISKQVAPLWQQQPSSK